MELAQFECLVRSPPIIRLQLLVEEHWAGTKSIEDGGGQYLGINQRLIVNSMTEPEDSMDPGKIILSFFPCF